MEKTTVSVTISIKHALKKYGDNVIIPDLNAEIKQGEFFTLLGPSGCGKTTLLRMIAGFNSIEGGDFYFNDKRINDLDPAKRNIGMVFQNYAIFPHLTVRKNVEFGLKNKKLPKAQIAEQTDKFMKLMQIDQYADRLPERLSGGQQQRVALARALCIQPDVLLFDEPLSNLDAKLRVQMRSELVRMHQKLGTTFVYITHDQVEAMTMGDYIAVLRDGKIMQYDTPQEVYSNPANLFTARFIGDPGMNCLHLPEGGYVGFRSRKVRLGRGDGALGLRFRAELSTKERLGGEFNYTVMLDGTTEIVIRSEEDLPTGQLLDFFVSREDLYAFHENEERIPLEELPAGSEGASYTLILAESIACQARRVG